jgi:hypothetical protein
MTYYAPKRQATTFSLMNKISENVWEILA